MSSHPLSVHQQGITSLERRRESRGVGILRVYGFGALLSVLLITVISLIIHSQPYNPRPIQAFLQAPDHCAAPCFLGVQPGITLGTDAQTILKAHPWVQQGSVYVAEDTTRRYIWISWHWSPASPSFLKSSGYMTFSPLEDGRIRDIEVQTALPFGAVWLALGMPDGGSVILEHVARYSNRWLFAETTSDCGQFWERQTGFYMVAPASLQAASDLLHIQSYDTILKSRGCLRQKKR